MKNLGAFILIVLLLSPAAASAQPQCHPYDEVRSVLEGMGYRQKSVWWGEVLPGLLLELFVHPRNGRWTLIEVHPDQITCVIRSGRAWGENFDKLDPET